MSLAAAFIRVRIALMSKPRNATLPRLTRVWSDVVEKPANENSPILASPRSASAMRSRCALKGFASEMPFTPMSRTSKLPISKLSRRSAPNPAIIRFCSGVMTCGWLLSFGSALKGVANGRALILEPEMRPKVISTFSFCATKPPPSSEKFS